MSGKNPHASAPRRDGPDAAELAALYLSGAMTGEEREAFESRLAAGDAALAAEVRLLQDAAGALLQDVDPVAPSPAVRRRLLQQLDAHAPRAPQIWRAWDTTDENPFFTLRAGDGQWEETGVEGVQVRRLFIDRPGNRMTAMFRMAA